MPIRSLSSRKDVLLSAAPMTTCLSTADFTAGCMLCSSTTRTHSPAHHEKYFLGTADCSLLRLHVGHSGHPAWLHSFRRPLPGPLHVPSAGKTAQNCRRQYSPGPAIHEAAQRLDLHS